MFRTEFIYEGIESCEDIVDLQKRILPLLTTQRDGWAAKVQEILKNTGLSCSRLAKLCGVSEPAVRKWRKGALPQSRDMYLRIGFAAGYTLEEMNAFLKRYGKCPQLYIKSLEDSACIFVLRSDTLEHTYASYQSVLNMLRDELQKTGNSAEEEERAFSTEYLNVRFTDLKSMIEMVAFVKQYSSSYKLAYEKLYRAVEDYLSVNLAGEFLAEGDGRRASFNAMATESRWSSSLRHCISQIRKGTWFPLRHKVISLGLHLNMDVEGINTLLEYAQMEPLYVKNPIEAAIVWAVNEAKLCSENDEIIPDGSSELCDFVKDVLEQLGLSEEGGYLLEDL